MRGTVSATGGASAWARAACLLALLAAAGRAAAQLPPPRPVVVTDIVVTGNHTVNTASILNKIKTRVGRPYDEAVVEEDVRTLHTLGSIRDVHVFARSTPDGKFVVEFQIEEPPNLIQDVVFKNDRHLKKEEIDTLKLLRKGMPLNVMQLQMALKEIKDFYQDKGYYFCEVQCEEGLRPGDTRIVINICEGPVVRVRHTYFVGNDTLATQPRLRTQIDTSRMFLGMPIGGVFQPAKVNGDVLKLLEYYKNNGYLEATVSRQVYFSDDFRTVDVIFDIHEGPRYHVKDVSVQGAHNVTTQELQSIIKLKAGDVYSEGVITADLRNIQDYIGWRGYAAKARPEPFAADPGLVSVHYEVADQQVAPSRVGNVIVTGNEVTKERVIRRLLGIYPGQVLEYPQMRLAAADLARSQLFENDPAKGGPPLVYVDPKTEENEFKDIVVQVKEAPTGSFMLGVGVNSNDGLVGNIVLNERNFDILRPPTSFSDIFNGTAWRGGGQEFRIEASPGIDVQRYTVSWREPYLFDLPYSLGVSGYYFDRIYNEDTEHRLGTRVVLGHQLNRYWSVSAQVRAELINIDNVSPFAPVDYTSVQGQNWLVGPGVTVKRDSRDSYLKPTEGSIVEATFEQDFGSFTFPVFTLDAKKYFPVYQRPDGSGKHVLALRSAVSWEGSEAPVYERFYGGGFNTIRGFAFRGVGPYKIGSDFNLYRTGGDFMFLNSVEYQVPIKANDHLYAVGFIDSGTVESTPTITNYRVSVGVGLRIVVPMMGPVPIALDFAVPLTHAPNDENQLFSFYVGVFR